MRGGVHCSPPDPLSHLCSVVFTALLKPVTSLGVERHACDGVKLKDDLFFLLFILIVPPVTIVIIIVPP